MNIDDIQAFLAVVSQQSVTRAADLLHISQSSVSHRLKNLEDELGVVLLERGKGVKATTLTAAGEDFIPLAEQWMQLLQETRSLKQQSRTVLAIGAVDSVNSYLLPNIYQQIIEEQPQLRLHIHTQNSAYLYDLMEQRTIDLAFVLHERVSKHITVTPFFAEPMVVVRVAAPGRCAAPVVHPSELNPREELYHVWFPAYQVWHNQWWDPFVTSHIQVSNGPMVRPLLKTPQQWAIVPLSIAKSMESRQRYVIQRLSEPPPDRICYKLTHKFAKTKTREAIALFDAFAERLLPKVDVISQYYGTGE